VQSPQNEMVLLLEQTPGLEIDDTDIACTSNI
jgi:hypothetical protein